MGGWRHVLTLTGRSCHVQRSVASHSMQQSIGAWLTYIAVICCCRSASARRKHKKPKGRSLKPFPVHCIGCTSDVGAHHHSRWRLALWVQLVTWGCMVLAAHCYLRCHTTHVLVTDWSGCCLMLGIALANRHPALSGVIHCTASNALKRRLGLHQLMHMPFMA